MATPKNYIINRRVEDLRRGDHVLSVEEISVDKKMVSFGVQQKVASRERVINFEDRPSIVAPSLSWAQVLLEKEYRHEQ